MKTGEEETSIHPRLQNTTNVLQIRPIQGFSRHEREEMMESSKRKIILEVIKGRRSIRSYKDGEVPRGMLMKILEAGRWAPTPSNVQSWRFIVVQEAKQLGSIKDLSPGFPREASAAIMVCSDQGDMQDFGEASRPILAAEEAAMAAQNMLLMAHCLGLGSCPVASFSRTGIRALLELPDHIRPILMVALGFSAEHPDPPRRKELSRITFWERYGGNDGQG
ncbi:MAG: nitroreductase family protein [Candidatus Thermoplasmatota archaeon]|nr:nitroreductase family protein [Candidatus Thermoplasmatota archaeon]